MEDQDSWVNPKAHAGAFGISQEKFTRWTGLSRRWFCRVEWKPQDCWVGAYWRLATPWRLDVWIILPPFGFPMLPIHFGWEAEVEH